MRFFQTDWFRYMVLGVILGGLPQVAPSNAAFFNQEQNSVENLLEQDPVALQKQAAEKLARASQANDREQMAIWRLALGKALQKTGQNREAADLIEKALVYLRAHDQKDLQGDALNMLGMIYRLMGDFDKSSLCHTRALDLFKVLGDRKNQAESLNYLGVTFRNIGDLQESERCYREGLDILQDKKSETAARLFNSLGSLKWYAKQLDQAQVQYKKALDIYQALHIEDDRFIGTLNNMGNVFRSQEEYSKALDYYQRALEASESRGDLNLLAVIKKNLGIMFLQKKDFSKAEKPLKESLDLAWEVGFYRIILEDLKGLSDLYRQQGRLDLALQISDQYLKEYEKQLRDQTNSIVLSLKAAHEVEIKAKEIALLKAQQDETRLMFALIFFVLSVIVVAIWLSRHRLKTRAGEALSKRERELKQRKDQLNLLKANLNQIENQYQRFFESAPDAIIVAELNGGIILNANPQAFDLLNTQSDVLMGASLFQRIKSDFREKMVEILANGNDGQMKGFETEIKQDPDQWIPVEISMHAVNEMGKEIIQLSLRDLRERKTLEHQLLQSQKLEAVGTLAGGIAHDFNNLLTVVRGYCEVINLKKQLAPSIQNKIQEIDKAAERAQILTRQLLAFSRKQVQHKNVFILNDLVNNMNKMLMRLIGEKIKIQTNFEPELEPIMADYGQLEQVIMNLAVNSRDAMPEGGTLTFSTSNTVLDDKFIYSGVVATGRFVQLSVIDTGIGMDEKTKERIFEPFFSTKKLKEGTGLGLSMVFGIIKQHKGFIVVDSEPGQGTRFDIFLQPLEDREAMAAHRENDRNLTSMKPLKKDEDLYGNGQWILVVEDDASLRQMLVQILIKHGYSVLQAGSGEEGIELYQTSKGKVDLILTDIVMPGINGKEMVESIRPPVPRNRVIYMSGYSDQILKFKDVEAEGAYFVEKPFKPSEILQCVQNVIHSKT